MPKRYSCSASSTVSEVVRLDRSPHTRHDCPTDCKKCCASTLFSCAVWNAFACTNSPQRHVWRNAVQPLPALGCVTLPLCFWTLQSHIPRCMSSPQRGNARTTIAMESPRQLRQVKLPRQMCRTMVHASICFGLPCPLYNTGAIQISFRLHEFRGNCGVSQVWKWQT